MKYLIALAAACATLTPALAQTDPHQPDNDGSAAASQTVPPGEIAPGIDPGTAAANADVAGNLTATDVVNANRKAQYAADIAKYDAAVSRHDRQSTRYLRQQRAYADAMAAWRVQVAACERGRQKACDAPAPDPASFY